MKSRKGGYKLVSLQLVELTTMVALAGLYGAIANSHDKPLLISDIIINGEKKNNLFCMVEKDGEDFIIKDVYGKDIKVNAQDEVEVTDGDYEDVTLEVTNIKALTKKQCEKLKCGDKVLKKTGNQRHLYFVTYKEHHVGMCLTYVDASVVETQSYDYTDNNWVYNSEDKSPISDIPRIPVVTNDDNGKVFEVIAGAWAKGGKKVNIMDAPASTTLTEDEIAKVKDGVFINGNFLGYKNPVLFPAVEYSGIYYGIIIGRLSASNTSRCVISAYSMTAGGNISSQYKFIEFSGYSTGSLYLLGKEIPNYPADTGTFTLKCVGGTLTWVQDV